MLPWMITPALMLLFAFAAAAAPVPKGGKTNAEKIIGRWELVKSDGKAPVSRHVVIFGQDGKMTLEVGSGDAVTRYTGKYTINHAAIDYELEMNDHKKAEKLTIRKFEDAELITHDPDGIEEQFKRAKDKQPER